MTELKELEKVRPCGRLETYSTSRHHLGFYNNVGLTATYTSPSSSSDSVVTNVFAALKSVVAKHPVLSVIALSEDKSQPDVYFARLPSYDLRACVEFQERQGPLPGDGETDEELDQLLTEQHNRNFKGDLGSKPFWRLAVLTSPTNKNTFTASWIFHHALSDGGSGLLFHETFLASLNTLEPNPDAHPIVEPPTTPLPPAFEDLHPLPISWPFFLTTLAKALFPSLFSTRPSKLWTGNPIPSPISPPKFHVRTVVFSATTSTQLARLARAHTTSVTALLECLLSSALFTALPADDCENLTFANPVSMRRFLKDVPADQLTIAVSQYQYTHHRPSSSSVGFDWSETHKVKEAITATLAKKGTDNPIALLRYVSDMHKYFTDQAGKQRDESVELSNVGV